MSPAKPKVLVVVTSHSTGWYLPEFAHPFAALEPHCDIVVASSAGGEAPLDPGSIEGYKADEVSSKFLKEQESLWKNTHKLEDFVGRADEFKAIFIVGGYGPMFDLGQYDVAHDILRDFYDKDRVISAICHGPAPLAHVKLPDTGEYMIKGHRVTGLSEAEVDAMPVFVPVPFRLESGLIEASDGHYEKADDLWGVKVITSKGPDGRIIVTGQNPASGTELGKAIYDAILEKA